MFSIIMSELIVRCQTFRPISTFSRYAGGHITKPDCCHRHKTEVEGVEETPVLPDNEHRGSENIEKYHG